MQQSEIQFKSNELIWAKVTGHPWWPGVIAEKESGQDSHLYRVDFFGYPPSHSLLPINKIIKYQDYSKLPSSQTSGRASPGLKRAISQATMLFNTLQQSKISPINNKTLKLNLFDTDNAITSITKYEQKHMEQQKSTVKQMENQISFSQSQELVIQKKRKLIQKNNKRIRMPRKRIEKQNLQLLNQEILEQLKKYQLLNIPDVQNQNKKQKIKYITRLLYRICKQFYSKQQSIEIALTNQTKINSKEQLNNFMSTYIIKNITQITAFRQQYDMNQL